MFEGKQDYSADILKYCRCKRAADYHRICKSIDVRCIYVALRDFMVYLSVVWPTPSLFCRLQLEVNPLDILRHL